MRKILLVICIVIFFVVCFVGFKSCSSCTDEQPNSPYSELDPDKDNIGNDIDW